MGKQSILIAKEIHSGKIRKTLIQCTRQISSIRCMHMLTYGPMRRGRTLLSDSMNQYTLQE